LLTNNALDVLNLNNNKYKKNLIITVGNPFRYDDGVGPYIAERIKCHNDNVKILNAQNNPENIIDDAIDFNPDKTVIIDGADFKEKAGTIKIIPEKLIPETSFSTHIFPIPIIAEILKQDTGSEIYYLGIQIKNTMFGKNLSTKVKTAALKIAKYINSQIKEVIEIKPRL
jgi:hydrogenase 3 maturation protease